MKTVPDTTTQGLFDTALRELAALALSRYPGEYDRLGRGLLLALNGHVALLDDGSALVRSGRDPEVVYRIEHGTCDCPDAARAPDARCKHLWAAVLVRRATCGQTPLEKALEPEAAAASTELPEGHELPPLVLETSRDEEAPVREKDDELMLERTDLPEAGASLNIKLKFGTSEVMYTARGHSDAEVLARLPGILAGVEKALARHDEAEAGFFTRLTRAFWPRQRNDTTGEQGA